MKLFSLLLLLLLLASSCTPQKRLSRLLDRHPGILERKTEIMPHTTVVPPIHLHKQYSYTLGQPVAVDDSLSNFAGSLLVTPDTIYFDLTRPADTIIQEIEIVKYEERPASPRNWPIILAIGFFGGFLLVMGVRR